MNYLERIISSRIAAGDSAPEQEAETAPEQNDTPVYTSARMSTRTSGRTSGYTSHRTSGRTSGRTSARTSARTSGRTSYTSYSSRYTSYTSARVASRTSQTTSQQHFGAVHPVDESFDPTLMTVIPTCSADLLGYGLHLIDE